MTPQEGALRGRMADLVGRAAGLGFPDADRLWRMTPAEAERALEAFHASRRAQAERDERLAWMAGYYFAVAMHAPRRYPRRSGTTFRPRGAQGTMTEAQMKATLMAFAKEMNADESGDLED